MYYDPIVTRENSQTCMCTYHGVPFFHTVQWICNQRRARDNADNDDAVRHALSARHHYILSRAAAPPSHCLLLPRLSRVYLNVIKVCVCVVRTG